MEYLGVWVTRDGIKPINIKIEKITNMKPPTCQKEVQNFIGVINYYCNMWLRRSHTLLPLTKLMFIKRNFKFTQVEQYAFNKIKRIVDCDTLLTCPDFNEAFKIHIDASAFQLGAVISHKGKTIAFYSRKMTYPQQQYILTERELLSIVETLKEFRTILLGHKLQLYTDHKSLTCKTFNTDRVLRWILILEEYGTYIEYTKGEKNMVANTM